MIEHVVLLGCSTAAAAALIRKLAPDSWRMRPPVGCNACLSAWTAFGIYLVAFAAGMIEFPLLGNPGQLVECGMRLLASAGIGGYLLAQINPPPVDFELPE